MDTCIDVCVIELYVYEDDEPYFSERQFVTRSMRGEKGYTQAALLA